MMKKKVFFLLLSLVIVVSLVLVGCSSAPSPTPPPSATQATTPPSTTTAPKTTTAPLTTTAASTPSASANVITLKYADASPKDGWDGTHAAQPWLAQVTKATNGRVQLQAYWNQSLFKVQDAWTDSENGVADVTWMANGIFASLTPLANVVTLPFLPFKSAEQASGIIWQLYQKYPTMASEFKANHVLIIYGSQPFFLATSKKQIKTMNDWKGLKLRTLAGPPVDLVKDLGAVPLTVPIQDLYLDLQKGVVDGSLVNWEAMMSFRLYEVVKYYTYVPLTVAYFSVVMNNNSWNKLPPDVQQEINSVSGLQGALFWGKNMFDSATEAGHQVVKQKGYPMVEYTVPQDEVAKWDAVAGQPVRAAWVKNMASQGHPEAQDILNTTESLIKSYNP